MNWKSTATTKLGTIHGASISVRTSRMPRISRLSSSATSEPADERQADGPERVDHRVLHRAEEAGVQRVGVVEEDPAVVLQPGPGSVEEPAEGEGVEPLEGEDEARRGRQQVHEHHERDGGCDQPVGEPLPGALRRDGATRRPGGEARPPARSARGADRLRGSGVEGRIDATTPRRLGQEPVGLLRRGVELRLHGRLAIAVADAGRTVENVPEARLVRVLDLAPLRDRRVRPPALDGLEERLVVLAGVAHLLLGLQP